MTVVQLSDLHIGATEGGADPTRDARAAIARVNELRPEPTAVIVSGDIVNDGTAAQYTEAVDLLRELAVAVHVLPGNHDDRRRLRSGFPLAGTHGDATDSDAPYRYAVQCGELRLVACDTLVPGHDPGAFDHEQLDWLDGILADDVTTPTLVVMHHPPMLTGMAALDEIGLPGKDRAAVAALLAEHPQVRRVACGHVHLAASGVVGRTPVLSSPSTWRVQFGFHLGPGEPQVVLGPSGLVVHALVEGELVSHVRTFDTL